ncbi:MAG: hypothetical protein ACXWJJ_05945 [Ramlibacter sp.]
MVFFSLSGVERKCAVAIDCAASLTPRVLVVFPVQRWFSLGEGQSPSTGGHPMTHASNPTITATQRACASDEGRWHRPLRRLFGASVVAATLALAGCGGGGDVGVVPTPGIGIDVAVAGTTYGRVSSGQLIEVAAAVGQAIEFDANEPVTWSFSVNGSPLFANGTTVDVGGVTISQVQFDPSRVVLQSTFDGPALLPIDVVLVATSSFDGTQVGTIHLRLG